MKLNIHKVQCVFQDEDDINKVFDKLDIIKQEKRGSLYTITSRGNRDEISRVFDGLSPVFMRYYLISRRNIYK